MPPCPVLHAQPKAREPNIFSREALPSRSLVCQDECISFRVISNSTLCMCLVSSVCWTLFFIELMFLTSDQECLSVRSYWLVPGNAHSMPPHKYLYPCAALDPARSGTSKGCQNPYSAILITPSPISTLYFTDKSILIMSFCHPQFCKVLMQMFQCVYRVLPLVVLIDEHPVFRSGFLTFVKVYGQYLYQNNLPYPN